MGKLKSVQYRVTYETKTVNQSFVGIPSVDFSELLFNYNLFVKIKNVKAYTIKILTIF